MKKIICNSCGNEINPTESVKKLNFKNSTREIYTNKLIEAIQQTLTTVNDEYDVCLHCVIDAFAKLDNRKKTNPDIYWASAPGPLPPKALSNLHSGAKIMIYGPTGCGKTRIGQAVANFLQHTSDFNIVMKDNESEVIISLEECKK